MKKNRPQHFAATERIMKAAKTAEKWWTIDQIADYLQVSKEKIYKHCQRGKMPASKFGGQWRFDKKEVDAWLRKQRPSMNKNKK